MFFSSSLRLSYNLIISLYYFISPLFSAFSSSLSYFYFNNSKSLYLIINYISRVFFNFLFNCSSSSRLIFFIILAISFYSSFIYYFLCFLSIFFKSSRYFVTYCSSSRLFLAINSLFTFDFSSNSLSNQF